MAGTANGLASVQLDAPDAKLYKIMFPDGRYYNDGQYDVWPMSSAKHIARNVARKNRVMVKLQLFVIEEVVTVESSYDRILNYVNSLKGKTLTVHLLDHGLTKGSDAVASKRERLIAHLLKCKHGDK